MMTYSTKEEVLSVVSRWLDNPTLELHIGHSGLIEQSPTEKDASVLYPKRLVHPTFCIKMVSAAGCFTLEKAKEA